MTLFLLIYLSGFIVNYGLTFGYFQREWPELAERDYRSDQRHAFVTSPVSWIAVFALFLFIAVNKKSLHGFKFF